MLRPPHAGIVILLAGCAVDVSGLGGGARDSGADGGSLTDGSHETDGGSGGDAEPGIDAGVAVPTVIADFPTAGTNDSHPAVVWNGTQFVVGVMVADGAGHQVDLILLDPGQARSTPTTRVTLGSPAPRKSITLAPRGGALAVGWVEDEGSEWALYTRILPDESSATRQLGSIRVSGDHDDAFFFWVGDRLHAVVRMDGIVGGEALISVDLGGPVVIPGLSFASATPRFSDLGWGLASRGPLLTSGVVGEMYRYASGGWDLGVRLTSPEPLGEGDMAELSDGTVLGLWTFVPAGGARELAVFRLVPSGDVYLQPDPPTRLGWYAPDPAVDVVSDRLVVAFMRENAGGRSLGLGMLDAAGTPLVGDCAVPAVLPFANEPDIACGAGWCAVVWMEATAYEAADYITRVMQVPADPLLVCP